MRPSFHDYNGKEFGGFVYFSNVILSKVGGCCYWSAKMSTRKGRITIGWFFFLFIYLYYYFIMGFCSREMERCWKFGKKKQSGEEITDKEINGAKLVLVFRRFDQ